MNAHQSKENYLKCKREERELNLEGKWLVVCNSQFETGVILYEQDPSLGKAFWTKFKCNAKGYTSKNVALNAMRRIHKGNPRLIRA